MSCSLLAGVLYLEEIRHGVSLGSGPKCLHGAALKEGVACPMECVWRWWLLDVVLELSWVGLGFGAACKDMFWRAML